jgi:glycerol-3-phosphate dehydrogenase (NAD(P)+)
MKIIILGNGQWGKALGSILEHNKKEFSFWEIDTEIPDVAIIINCLPANVMRSVLANYGKNLKSVIFINGAKGIEEGTHKLPYEIVKEVLGKEVDYFTLIGPGFAREIVAKMPTLVNIGFTNNKNALLVEDLFQNDYFRVRLVKGVAALELSSAFKNVYAIACGIADGLGFESNTRAQLIVLAIEEFYELAKSLGISLSKDMVSGTVGDLILTCSSIDSRNYRFGKLLVGKNHMDALKEIGETVEGHSTTSSIPYFEQKARLSLSLASFVYTAVNSKNVNIKEEFLKLVKEI